MPSYTKVFLFVNANFYFITPGPNVRLLSVDKLNVPVSVQKYYNLQQYPMFTML